MNLSLDNNSLWYKRFYRVLAISPLRNIPWSPHWRYERITRNTLKNRKEVYLDLMQNGIFFRNPSVVLDILLITFWREISWYNTLSQWCIQKYIHCSYIYFADWLFIFVNSYGVKYMYLAILKTQQVIPGQLYFKNKIL